MKSNEKIAVIAAYGKRYIKEPLDNRVRQREQIRKHWYEGLRFFFERSFYRGRRDTLSKRFMEAALHVLDKFGGEDIGHRQVAEKIKLVRAGGGSKQDFKDAIIEGCREAGVSPLLFNAGAWMVGSKSFNLLIEKL